MILFSSLHALGPAVREAQSGAAILGCRLAGAKLKLLCARARAMENTAYRLHDRKSFVLDNLLK
jgi:hypothetical protein